MFHVKIVHCIIRQVCEYIFRLTPRLRSFYLNLTEILKNATYATFQKYYI